MSGRCERTFAPQAADAIAIDFDGRNRGAPRWGSSVDEVARRGLVATAIVLALLGLSAAPASATWSIVGTDPETGEVGVAIASCVPAFAIGDTTNLMALVPGVGAGVSQANFNPEVPGQMQGLLADGVTAADVIAAVSAEAFDAQFNERQHGVVQVNGAAAGFTGEETLAVALDQQRTNVSAQGNILVSDAVVIDSLNAFETRDGDLTAKLVAGLAAGSAAGGDSRCPQQTALFASVAVAAPGDAPGAPGVNLQFAVETDSETNPVDLLVTAHADGIQQMTQRPSLRNELGGTLFLYGLGALSLVGFFALVWTRRNAPTS